MYVKRSVRAYVVFVVVPEVTPQGFKDAGDGGVDVWDAAEVRDGGGDEGVQRGPVIDAAFLKVEC